MSAPLLQIRALSKSFPGVRALDGVDITLHRGEIHALMGENGAGKSTLIKVLTGVYPSDGGRILFNDTPIAPQSPRAAEALGISTVYQEVNLIPDLSVAENICLGREPTRLGKIQWRKIAARAKHALKRLDLNVDSSRQIRTCSVAVQQMVAIARALDVEATVLVLDEPTSSLDQHEVAELFNILRKLREDGMAILFVTHFLDQVYEISERITVLRNGQLVGQYDTANLSRLELVSHMIGVGRKIKKAVRVSQQKPNVPSQSKTVPLLETRAVGRKQSIAPFDMTIASGEVVGLAGLLGSGRTEIARLLFGIDSADTGRILVRGKETSIRSPRDAIACGFALTPEDRNAAGIVPDLTVRENIVLALQASRGIWRKLPKDEQVSLANRLIQALDIRASSPDQAARDLSGGNQQKVLLARWLATEPALLLLDEPTRGIDIGAKAEIEKQIALLREKGMAILFISSELEEIVRNSQRVIVLRDRQKVGELIGEATNEQAIMKQIAAHVEASPPDEGSDQNGRVAKSR